MQRYKFTATPIILSKDKGEITSVLRPHDDAILEVGMLTKSGGVILSIKKNKRAVGNMFAEIGRPGNLTAISAIVI